MPELPEIEHLKRTLEPALIGAKVSSVDLRRRDVVHGPASNSRSALRVALLQGARIERLIRHGKNLAILGSNHHVICVHLGMSGQMRVVKSAAEVKSLSHMHCLWKLQTQRGAMHLVFRDPRRFGGLWPFDSEDSLLQDRWASLGPDALTITPMQLRQALQRSTRCIKAVLLDQSALAGVGNIYADESLFAAGIHPRSCAEAIPPEAVAKLCRAIKHVLRAAINAGGSTLRDYADGQGRAGTFTMAHAVYGCGGQSCLRCERLLDRFQICQRTTVACGKCQRVFR